MSVAAHLEDEFGDIIRKARKGVGISAEELASLAGLSVDDLARVERYELLPKSDAVRRLAETLHLSVAKLEAIAEGKWLPEPPEFPAVEAVEVPVGGYAENCYILGTKDGAAAIIDPGGAPDMIVKRAQHLALQPRMILITHTHSDHIGGVDGILRACPGTSVASFREFDGIPGSTEFVKVKDGTRLDVGGTAITVRETPGHTPGSVCYETEGAIFAGDTLFAGSIGGPMSAEIYQGMLQAIRSKILSLPDDTAIFPGHGPATTVGQEKAHNAFF